MGAGGCQVLDGDPVVHSSRRVTLVAPATLRGTATGPALDAWGGRPAWRAAGQRALAQRVAMNIAAMEGRYTPELDLDAA